MHYSFFDYVSLSQSQHKYTHLGSVHQATLQNACNQIKKFPSSHLQHIRKTMITVIPVYIIGHQRRTGSLCTVNGSMAPHILNIWYQI